MRIIIFNVISWGVSSVIYRPELFYTLAADVLMLGSRMSGILLLRAGNFFNRYEFVTARIKFPPHIPLIQSLNIFTA